MSAIWDRVFSLCSRRNLEGLRALAEEVGSDAVIAARCPAGGSALHVACRQIHSQMVLQLLDWGADPNAFNTTNYTPIYRAKQSPKVVRLLVERGAEVNVVNTPGYSPLGLTRDRPKTVEALLDGGASVMLGKFSVLRQAGRTARETATGNRHGDAVKLLDAALLLAQRWDRRLAGSRIGLAAADGRSSHGRAVVAAAGEA